ncbi:hypothetical protein [Nocardiopsis composta]|uniref:Uncharacterized protein n=1 Tax=Nocardiopsis composta TaxID=157465 RepID=A0A7W8VGY1_9ACTN|nr:hypothetical protein [Nocardiopsis composta]MBB5436076.1 hypothetical protein [Nocardiopsis composta]
MTRRSRALLAVLSAGAAVAALVCLGWWAYREWDLGRLLPGPDTAPLAAAGVAALLAALGLAVLLAAGSRAEGGRPGAGAAVEPPEDAEAPHRRKHVFRLELPSARRDYPFLFSAVVCWRGAAAAESAAEGAAVCAIEGRARALCAAEQPEEHSAAQFRLTAALGPEPCRHPGVDEAWAEEVRLEISAEDEERLARLRELRKTKAAREEERELERLEQEYLGGEVLSDPGRAVVWWLARHPERVEEAVARIGTLTRLSSAATGRRLPDVYRELTEAVGGAQADREPAARAEAPHARPAPPFPHADPYVGQVYGYTPEDEEETEDPRPAAPAPAAGARRSDQDPWLHAAAIAAGDWEDEEEYEGFLQRFAVFLKSNGYTESASRIRDTYGLGPGFPSVFGSASDFEPDPYVGPEGGEEDEEEPEDAPQQSSSGTGTSAAG